MKKIIKYTLSALVAVLMLSFTLRADKQKTQYKCLIQMVNYSGEGAYVVVSVLDTDNNYVKTLQVMGDDTDWYSDITTWWAFQKTRSLSEIDAISGETLTGGERATFILNIDEKWMNKGYKLRFETAVEELSYTDDDLEIPLDTKSIRKKHEGKELIRYVRLLPLK